MALVDEAQEAGAQLHLGFDAELWLDGDRLVGVRDRETLVCAGLGTTAILRPVSPSIVVSPVWGVIVEMCLPQPLAHIVLEAESQLSLVDRTYRAPAADVEDGVEVGLGCVTAGGVTGPTGARRTAAALVFEKPGRRLRSAGGAARNASSIPLAIPSSGRTSSSCTRRSSGRSTPAAC